MPEAFTASQSHCDLHLPSSSSLLPNKHPSLFISFLFPFFVSFSLSVFFWSLQKEIPKYRWNQKYQRRRRRRRKLVERTDGKYLNRGKSRVNFLSKHGYWIFPLNSDSVVWCPSNKTVCCVQCVLHVCSSLLVLAVEQVNFFILGVDRNQVKGTVTLCLWMKHTRQKWMGKNIKKNVF